MRVSKPAWRAFATAARSPPEVSSRARGSGIDPDLGVWWAGVEPGVAMASSSRTVHSSAPATMSTTAPPQPARGALSRPRRGTDRVGAGRARICTTISSATGVELPPVGESGAVVVRSSAAASSAVIGSPGGWSSSGSPPRRASRSSPPVTTGRALPRFLTGRPLPGIVTGRGPAGVVRVVAPGQAAVMARSTRPGGIGPGTQTRMVAPAGVRWYSKLRCGCPVRRRRQRGRSSPARLPHNAAAPSAAGWGGASTVTTRAPACRCRCRS
jgi:hypothetical protein